MIDPPKSFEVLLLCRDLLFTSKITATAHDVRIPLRLIRDPKLLHEAPASEKMIVDLTQPGFLEAAAEWKQRTGGKVIGFAGHTELDLFDRAKSAGFEQVLSRGAFVSQLNQLLTEGHSPEKI